MNGLAKSGVVYVAKTGVQVVASIAVLAGTFIVMDKYQEAMDKRAYERIKARREKRTV